MRGEKFISREIKNGISIRKHKIKEFDIDFIEIAEHVYESTEDNEELYMIYGISMFFDDGFYSLNVDKILHQFETELLELDKEDDEVEISILKKYIKVLQPTRGYEIYFDR